MELHLYWALVKRQFEGMPTPILLERYNRLKRTDDLIVNGTMKRGEHFWGGFDDAISNELGEVEFEIARRALQDFDKAAADLIHSGSVSAYSFAQEAQNLIALIRVALEEGRQADALALATSAKLNFSEEPNLIDETEDNNADPA